MTSMLEHECGCGVRDCEWWRSPNQDKVAKGGQIEQTRSGATANFAARGGCSPEGWSHAAEQPWTLRNVELCAHETTLELA